MGFKRYKMLQKYINGEPQEEYRQGELIDDTIYSTLDACNEGNQKPDEPIADTTYQWVTIDNEYLCANYSKYTKEKEQISYDRGVTWEDTGKTRRGELIEPNSEDCGYNHILFRYEDDEVLFEMYEPCWFVEESSRTPRLNIRVWNKGETNIMRTTLYIEGAHNRGWKDIQPQTDETFSFSFSTSSFYNSNRYYILVSEMVGEPGAWWLYNKYNTGYFSFTGSEIKNECE